MVVLRAWSGRPLRHATISGEHDGERTREPFFRRIAAGGAVPAISALDPGRRRVVGDRARSARHHQQRPALDPLDLGYGVGRDRMAVALFSAWRGDRGADLVP